jgi:thiamine pyrophosphate-dependent acetolactate synthase large subunit-like protein
VIVFSDGYLGQIRAQQLESGLDEEMTRLHMPDIELLARAHGLRYERAAADLGDVLADCVASRAPALIEIRAQDSPARSRRKTWRQVRRKVVDTIRG